MTYHKNMTLDDGEAKANIANTDIANIDIQCAIESALWDKEQQLSEAVLYNIVQQAVAASFHRLGFENLHSELSMVFTDDATIAKINAQWRNKDKATNVLSFPAFPIKPYEKCGPLLGDIIIAYETVAREAQAENKTFHDHLSHLIIHGLLHLLGFDHETEEQAEEMEKLEREILAGLAISDPYAL